MSNEKRFIIVCLMTILQLISGLLNFYILTRFYRNSGLRGSKHLRLILYLTISDFLFAICEIPFSTYLTVNWNWNVLDFDPRFILISSTPLPSQLKISAILNISIALNRNIALFYPGVYLRMRQDNYAIATVALSLCFALIDVVLFFSMSDYTPKLGCSSSGCFVGDRFRYYWGISNMSLGIVIVLLCTTMFLKIDQRSKQVLRKSTNDSRFRQANRTSLGILVSSLVFLTIPSVFAGLIEMFGISIFELVGPFYTACLLSNGICNAIIFIVNNTDRSHSVNAKSGSNSVHINATFVM